MKNGWCVSFVCCWILGMCLCLSVRLYICSGNVCVVVLVDLNVLMVVWLLFE